MRTTIFLKDKTDLNLTKAMFKVMPTHTGKNYIDAIYFHYTGLPNKNIFTYNQLSEMTEVFCVRKEKAKTGFSYYKTFQGLITRLYEDVYQYRKENNLLTKIK